ncbi:hypothetical protein RQP46_009483 [Phenoliferia psychrophenolica]
MASTAFTTGATGYYTGNFGESPNSVYTVPPGLTPVANEDYFTSPQVSGFVYPDDPKTRQARTDYTNASKTATACPASTTFVAATKQMAHLVLKPGVYYSAVDMELAASSDLVLNGAFGDVFVFNFNQINTGASSRIRLIGGVTAASVFWNLADTMTLGASSEFQGQAISNSVITIGASVLWCGAGYAMTTWYGHHNVKRTELCSLCESVQRHMPQQHRHSDVFQFDQLSDYIVFLYRARLVAKLAADQRRSGFDVVDFLLRYLRTFRNFVRLGNEQRCSSYNKRQLIHPGVDFPLVVYGFDKQRRATHNELELI